MKITKRQLRRIIKEQIGESSVTEVQKLVDGNQWLKGSVVKPDDLIDAGRYVVYASDAGLGHIKDRHQDANAPGSLMNTGVDLRELIAAIAATPPHHKTRIKIPGWWRRNGKVGRRFISHGPNWGNGTSCCDARRNC